MFDENSKCVSLKIRPSVGEEGPSPPIYKSRSNSPRLFTQGHGERDILRGGDCEREIEGERRKRKKGERRERRGDFCPNQTLRERWAWAEGETMRQKRKKGKGFSLAQTSSWEKAIGERNKAKELEEERGISVTAIGSSGVSGESITQIPLVFMPRAVFTR